MLLCQQIARQALVERPRDAGPMMTLTRCPWADSHALLTAYGYTVGGPLRFRHKVRDPKTFFFWAQEWNRITTAPVAVNTTVPTAQGRASRDSWVKANHCQATTTPVEPSPCVAYAGCDPGALVTWCEFAGGHTIPPFAAA